LAQRDFAGAVRGVVRRLWLDGLSTRDIARASAEELGFGTVSNTTIAQQVRDAAEEVLHWLNRPVRPDIVYLALDAKWVSVLRESSSKEPVLIAVGITADGHKEILDVMPANAESQEAWSTLLARLKSRGLPVGSLRLVVTDGCAGLISAVQSQLPKVRRQRCVVHKTRNIVGRSPANLNSIAPKEASAIWKAPNRAEALSRAKAFIAKYSEDHPKLADIVRDDLDATLAFYDLDATVWATLRSTNVQERMHRELHRKFAEVGALKGETAVTRVAVLLAKRMNELCKDEVIKGFKRRRS
jgi:transposase-like protein